MDDGHLGVFISYEDSIEKTLLELDLMGCIPPSSTNVFLSVKDGFDGAGSQPEIRDKQVKHMYEEGGNLNKMELMGYVPLSLEDISTGQKQVTFVYSILMQASAHNVKF